MSAIEEILDNLEESQKSDFTLMLEALDNKLTEEGQFTGLCPACLGTEHEVVIKGNYTGIEAIKDFDEDIDEVDIQLKKCFHGQAIDDSAFEF